MRSPAPSALHRDGLLCLQGLAGDFLHFQGEWVVENPSLPIWPLLWGQDPQSPEDPRWENNYSLMKKQDPSYQLSRGQRPGQLLRLWLFSLRERVQVEWYPWMSEYCSLSDRPAACFLHFRNRSWRLRSLAGFWTARLWLSPALCIKGVGWNILCLYMSAQHVGQLKFLFYSLCLLSLSPITWSMLTIYIYFFLTVFWFHFARGIG